MPANTLVGPNLSAANLVLCVHLLPREVGQSQHQGTTSRNCTKMPQQTLAHAVIGPTARTSRPRQLIPEGVPNTMRAPSMRRQRAQRNKISATLYTKALFVSRVGGVFRDVETDSSKGI